MYLKKKKETLIESLLLVCLAYSIFLLPVKHSPRAESFEVDRLSLKKKKETLIESLLLACLRHSTLTK